MHVSPCLTRRSVDNVVRGKELGVGNEGDVGRVGYGSAVGGLIPPDIIAHEQKRATKYGIEDVQYEL